MCVYINKYIIVLQSRRVKEENPEVSGGNLLIFNFFCYFILCPTSPTPEVSAFVSLEEETSKYYSHAVVERKKMDLAFARPYSV